jgi:hypothetical protein
LSLVEEKKTAQFPTVFFQVKGIFGRKISYTKTKFCLY